ncbi:MAG: hypothetical protein ACP5VS_14545 [Desulfomonilaceae bacterium]
MCDAGGEFKENLTFHDLKLQVTTVLSAHKEIDPKKCVKLKIQFTRMGEPSLNDTVNGPEMAGRLREDFLSPRPTQNMSQLCDFT